MKYQLHYTDDYREGRRLHVKKEDDIKVEDICEYDYEYYDFINLDTTDKF